MSQESFVFLLGLGVILTPFLGVPNDWKEWIFVGIGTLIAVMGYRLRRAAYLRSIETPHGERRADAFVESSVRKIVDGESFT
jgi:hypothetical protein